MLVLGHDLRFGCHWLLVSQCIGLTASLNRTSRIDKALARGACPYHYSMLRAEETVRKLGRIDPGKQGLDRRGTSAIAVPEGNHPAAPPHREIHRP
jgi:hypothetical protein